MIWLQAIPSDTQNEGRLHAAMTENIDAHLSSLVIRFYEFQMHSLGSSAALLIDWLWRFWNDG